jgi:glycine oxidase
MLSARELSMAGVRVTLLERGRTGRESSWAGGGIVSPLYPWRYADSITALARWSQARYQALSETLAADTGIDPEWTRNGLLTLAPAEEPAAVAWAGDSGTRLQLVSPEEIARLEPALRSPSAPGIWMPRIAQVRNPRLVKALRQDLLQRGVEIREGVELLEIIPRNGRIDRVVTSAGEMTTGCLLLCAGAWSGRLLARQGIGLAVTPVQGQMILFRTPPGAITRITLGQDRYVIPRRDGRVLFGSTLEQTGFDKRTTAQAREELRQIAVSRFPVLETAPIEHHWAGLRPGSPNGIPFITPVPGIEGLYINAGHYRNGVVLAPASARLMADLILGREPILPPAPYRLEAERDQLFSVGTKKRAHPT